MLLVNMCYWNSHIHCEHLGHKNDTEHASVTIGSFILYPVLPQSKVFYIMFSFSIFLP